MKRDSAYGLIGSVIALAIIAAFIIMIFVIAGNVQPELTGV